MAIMPPTTTVWKLHLTTYLDQCYTNPRYFVFHTPFLWSTFCIIMELQIHKHNKIGLHVFMLSHKSRGNEKVERNTR